MPYATQTNLTERYGSAEIIQLTDRTNTPPTTIDATVVARAIADGDAVIDGYLRARYALPLSAVPELILTVSCSLARYNLHSFVGGAEAREDVKEGRKAALSVLKDIASGAIALTAAGIDQTTSSTVLSTTRDQVFSDEALSGFMGRS